MTTDGTDPMGQLQAWTDALRAELGIDADVPVEAILDVARDAAHGVMRPAAPVSAYLLGLAVAQGADAGAAAAVIARLAADWSQPA